MHTVGDNTRDHITLGQRSPAETGLPTDQTEESILRYAHRALAAGITILFGTYLATLTVALITVAESPFETQSARLFASIGFMSLNCLGIGLILIAGIERITRQSRTLIRMAMAQARANAALNRDNQQAIETSNRLASEAIVGLAAVRDRLTAVETAIERVPDYGRGVIDGATMRANALGDQ